MPTVHRFPATIALTLAAACCRAAHSMGLTWRGGMLALLLLCGGLWPLAASQAQGIELTTLKAERSEDSLTLSFSTAYELPKPVEDALVKHLLPVYFVAEATVFRSRWYWRDQKVAKVNRSWRLTWQPLTGKYRVSLGILSQTYPTLGEALASMRSVSGWRVAELSQLDDDGKYYLEFSYKLDTSQLPKPMQIGLGLPEGWAISVTRSMGIDSAAVRSPSP